MSDWDFDGYDFVDDFGNPIPLDPSDELNTTRTPTARTMRGRMPTPTPR